MKQVLQGAKRTARKTWYRRAKLVLAVVLWGMLVFALQAMA